MRRGIATMPDDRDLQQDHRQVRCVKKLGLIDVKTAPITSSATAGRRSGSCTERVASPRAETGTGAGGAPAAVTTVISNAPTSSLSRVTSRRYAPYFSSSRLPVFFPAGSCETSVYGS